MVFGWFKRKGTPASKIAAQPEQNAGFRRKVLFEAMEARVLLSGDFGLPPDDLNDPLQAMPDADALVTTDAHGGALLAEPISAPDSYPELPADQTGDVVAGSEIVASGDDSLFLSADATVTADAESFVPATLPTEWIAQQSLGGASEVVIVDGSVAEIDKLIAQILNAPVADIAALLAVADSSADAEVADDATSPSAGDASTSDTPTVAAEEETGPRLISWTRADGSQLDIIILDATRDGVAQVSDILENYVGLTAVHLLSHGTQGSVRLGTSTLSTSRLDDEQARLATWGRALAADGDLLLYGCDVGHEEAGVTFVQQLAVFTGADVAASDDGTGSGGDWILEVSTGVIETAAFTVEPAGIWNYTLANITGTVGNDTLTSLASNDTLIGQAGNDNYVFNNGFGTDTVSEAGTGGVDDTLNFSAVTSDLTFTIYTGGKIEVTAGGSNKVTATNVENITGGTGTNTFIFKDGASLKGNLLSAGGTNVFTFEGAAVIRIDQLKNQMNRVGEVATVTADTINSGKGDDRILGDNSTEVINGNAGDDLLAGNGGNDTLTGGAGNDRLYDEKVSTGTTTPTSTGNDTFTGGAGDDTYILSRDAWGTDKVIEAASGGTDTLDLSDLSADLTMTVGAAATGFSIVNGANTLTGAGAGSIIGVEIVSLGSGINTIALDDGWLDGLTITSAASPASAVLDLSLVSADLEIELGANGDVTVSDGTSTLNLTGIASIKGGTGTNVFYVTADSTLSGAITQTASKAAGATNVLDYTKFSGSEAVAVDMAAGRATGLMADSAVTAAFEQQQLTLTGATGGTFTIGLDTATVELAWDASADAIEAALKAVPGVGDVSVTGTGPFEITFGDWKWDRAALTVDDSGLTGTTPSASVTTVTEGVAGFGNNAFAGVGKVVFGDGTSLLIGCAGARTVGARGGGAVIDGATGAIDYTFTDARSISVSERVAGSATTAEVQRLVIKGQGGSFTLTLGGTTTGAISWDGTDATLATSIQTALNDVLGANTVTVAAAGTDTFDVTFTANGVKPAFTYDLANLEGVTTGSRGSSSVVGSSAADQLVAGARGDYIDGAGGDDTIIGNSGGDTLAGGAGLDAIDGGGGDDTLSGGAGKDTLKGGAGEDTLVGGAGDDSLVGGTGDDTYTFENGWGTDTLTELVKGGGEGDTVDFSAVSANMTFVLSNGYLQAGTGAFTPTVAQDLLKSTTQSTGEVGGSFAAGDLLTVGSDKEAATPTALHDESFFAVETVKLPAADSTVLFGNDWSQGVGNLAVLTPELLRNFFDMGDRELTLDTEALSAAGKLLVLDFRQVTDGLEFEFEKVMETDADGNETGAWHVQLTIEKTADLALPFVEDPVGEASYGKLVITHIDANTTIYGGREENTFKLKDDVVVDADIIGGEGVRNLGGLLSVDTLNGLMALELPEFMVKNTIDYTGSDFLDATLVRLGESSASVVTSLDNDSAGQREVQQLKLTSVTSGTFTLTFDGTPTGPITYSSTPATLVANVQAALNASLATHNITASAGAEAGTVKLTFAAEQDQALIVANDVSLAGTGKSIAVTELTGGARDNETQRFGYSAEAGTFMLTYNGQTTAALAWNATAADVETALEALTSVNAGGVTVSGTGTYNNPFVFEFTDVADKSAAGAFHQLAAMSSDLARSDQKLAVSTVTEGTAPLKEIQQVDVDATGGDFTLTFGTETTGNIDWNADAAAVKAALEALPNVTTVNVTGSGAAADPWLVEFVDHTEGSNAPELVVFDWGLEGNTRTGTVTTVQDGTATASANEVQRIESALTTGKFYLEYDGERTAAIAWNASDADVKAALEALNPVATATVKVVNEGADPGTNEKQSITRSAEGGTFTITFAGQTTGPIDWDATADDISDELESLSNVSSVTVTGDGSGNTPWVVEFVATSEASKNVPLMIVDSSALTREKEIEVNVTRSGSAGSYSWDVTFTTPAATDVAQLGAVEPGTYTQHASQFTGKLLNIGNVTYAGAANLMIGSNMGVSIEDMRALWQSSNFLSDPKAAFTTWFSGLSAAAKDAILNGNFSGADRFEIGGNPLTDALDFEDNIEDSSLGDTGQNIAKIGNSLLGTVAGEFIPETFSPGVHILAGMTGGDTYAFSGVWGVAAVVEVPDIVIKGVTVPEAFDTLDLSGVDADLEITVYEITTANFATFQKLFANVEGEEGVLATNSMPALAIGSNVVIVRDGMLNTEAEAFGIGEIPEPIPNGNYIIANDIENIIGGEGETTISFVGNAKLAGTVSAGGDLVLDYSRYYDPSGIQVDAGAGVDYKLELFDPNDFLPQWYIDLFGKQDEVNLFEYTFGSAEAVSGSRMFGLEAVLAAWGVPAIGEFMSNFAVSSLTGVTGSDWNDTFTGNDGDNTFNVGNGGNDTIAGMDGDDMVGFGDAEDDGVVVDLGTQQAWYTDGDVGSGYSAEVTAEIFSGIQEVQRLVLANVGAGTFTLTHGTTTTAAITWNADEDVLLGNIQSALDAAFGADKLYAGSSADNTFEFIFATDGTQTPISINTAGLTPAAAISASITEQTTGNGGTAEVQRLVLANVQGGTFTLTQGANTTAAITWSATEATLAASIQAALNSALTPSSVTVTSTADNSFDITWGANGAQAALTANTTSLQAIGASISEISDGTQGNSVQTVLHDGFDGAQEVQNLAITATGGNFTLTLGEWTTGNITWADDDATLKANIQAALDAVLGAGTVTVDTSDDADNFTVTFSATAPQQLLTANVAGLTGTGAKIAVSELESGAWCSGSFTLTYGSETTAALAADASADDVKAALESLTGITEVLVLGAGTPDDPWSIIFIDADLDSGDFKPLTIDSSNLKQVITQVDAAPQAGVKEVQTLTFTGASGSTVGSFTLTVGGHTTGAIAWSATDATLKTAMQKALDAALGSGVVSVATTGSNDVFTLTYNSAGAQATVASADLGGITAGAPTFGAAVTTAGTTVSPASAEIQQVAFTNATGGTFTLTLGDLTTAAITYSATDATLLTNIQSALDTLLGAGTVTVSDSGASTFDITWAANGYHPQFTATTTGLTGTNAAAEISTLNEGLAPNAVQSFGHNADAGLFTVTYGGQVTAPLAHDVTAEQLRDELKALGNIRDVEVSGSGTLGDPWVITLHDADLTGGNVGALAFNTADVFTGMAVNKVEAGVTASAGVAEVQRLLVDATGGSFTLTFGGQTTVAISYDATEATLAASIESALNAIIGSGTSVIVKSGAENTFDVTFNTAVPQAAITATATSLTGGAGTVTITEETAGARPNTVQSLVHDAFSGTFKLSYGTQQTGPIAWNATPAVIATALEALGDITDVTVTGSGTAASPWAITFVDATLEEGAFKALTLDAALLVHVQTAIDTTSAGTPANATQTFGHDADRGAFSLSYNGESTSLLAANATAAQVQAALLALEGITAVTVTGNGTIASPFSFAFTGATQNAGNYYELGIETNGLAHAGKDTWTGGLLRAAGTTPGEAADVTMSSIEQIEGSGNDDIFIGDGEDNVYKFVGEWGHDVIYESIDGGDDRLVFEDDDGEKLEGVKAKVLGNGVTFYWTGDENNPTASLYAFHTEGAPDDERGLLAAFREDVIDAGIETFYKDTVLGGLSGIFSLTADSSGSVTTELTETELAPVVEEAISRWVAAGADEAFLRGLRFELSDLGAGVIGQTGLNKIYLDRTANGNGWYVDSTPADDAEFAVDGAGYLAWAAEGTSAAEGIDLLTVVMHEMGHQLGMPHDGTIDSIMRDSMAEGMRITLPQGGTGEGSVLGAFAGAQDDQEKILNGLTVFRDWADGFGDSVDSYFGSLTLPLLDISIGEILDDGLDAAATGVGDAIADGMDALYDSVEAYFTAVGNGATVQGMIDYLQADAALTGLVQIDRSGSTNPNEFVVVIRTVGYQDNVDLSVDALGGFFSVEGDQIGVEAAIDLTFIFGLDENGDFYVEQPGVTAGFQVGHAAHDIVDILTDDNGIADGGNARFSIAGDISADFGTGDDIAVLDSYGNDGYYRVLGVAYDSVNDVTLITIDGTVGYDVAQGSLRNTYDFGLNVGPFGVEVNNGIIGVHAEVEFGTDAHLLVSDLDEAGFLGLIGMPDLDADAGYEVFLPVSFGGVFSGVDGQLGAISAFSGDLPAGASLLEMIAAVPNTVNVYGMDEIFDMQGVSLDMIIQGLFMVLDELVGTEPGTIVEAAVTELTTGVAGTAETQQVSFENVTGGTFALNLGEVTTGNITWSATDATLAANIQAALDSALGASTVTVTTTAAGTFALAFAEAGDQQSFRVLQGDLDGQGVSANVIQTTAGSGTAAVQRLTLGNAVDGSFTLTSGSDVTASIDWDADDRDIAAGIEAALNAAAMFGAGAANVTVSGSRSYDITWRAAGPQSALSVDSSNLSAGEPGAIYDSIPLINKSAAELLGGGGVDFLAAMRDAIGEARDLSNNIQELQSYLNNGLAEVLGLDVPGIAITEQVAGTASTAEVQRLAISETTGGVFSLALGATGTGDIAWTADDAALATNIQNALNAALGASTVSVAAVAGEPGSFDITFGANGAQSDLTAETGELAGTFDLISMSYADNTFNFGLSAEFSAHYDDAFGINLADLGELVGIPSLDGIGLDLSASAALDLDASALFELGFGFDLSNVIDPEFFITDTTGIELSASAQLSNLDITAAFEVA
ncbi:MAG: hypothetical protein K0Q68_2601, partial [Moraxellaceae bacterium]|nr:hypothetical protein [Moraxellaceae bacterium]